MDLTIKKLSDVHHLVPKNSIYAKHYDQKYLRFVVIEGDYHFERP